MFLNYLHFSFRLWQFLWLNGKTERTQEDPNWIKRNFTNIIRSRDERKFDKGGCQKSFSPKLFTFLFSLSFNHSALFNSPLLFWPRNYWFVETIAAETRGKRKAKITGIPEKFLTDCGLRSFARWSSKFNQELVVQLSHGDWMDDVETLDLIVHHQYWYSPRD